jgi:type I restriction enzyme S subunit
MSIGPNSLLIRTPNNQFFNYYLQNPSFKKKLRGIISKTTLEKFNKTQFKELTITFPSAQECNSIVATLDDLNAKCKVLQDNYTKTIALCDDLKQALLRKAFNGEL